MPMSSLDLQVKASTHHSIPAKLFTQRFLAKASICSLISTIFGRKLVLRQEHLSVLCLPSTRDVYEEDRGTNEQYPDKNRELMEVELSPDKPLQTICRLPCIHGQHFFVRDSRHSGLLYDSNILTARRLVGAADNPGYNLHKLSNMLG